MRDIDPAEYLRTLEDLLSDTTLKLVRTETLLRQAEKALAANTPAAVDDAQS